MVNKAENRAEVYVQQKNKKVYKQILKKHKFSTWVNKCMRHYDDIEVAERLGLMGEK